MGNNEKKIIIIAIMMIMMIGQNALDETFLFYVAVERRRKIVFDDCSAHVYYMYCSNRYENKCIPFRSKCFSPKKWKMKKIIRRKRRRRYVQ